MCEQFSWEFIDEIFQEEEEKKANVTLIEDFNDEESVMPGILWQEWKRNKKTLQCSTFTEGQLLIPWADMQPKIQSCIIRGPKGKIRHLDALFCTLFWYKSGLTYDEVSALFHFKVKTLISAMEIVPPILLKTLRSRWRVLPRPIPLSGKTFPYIDLLVDTTTMEFYRPKTRFEEAKVYFDGENKIYGLKKEVAVLAQKPHFALSFQNA